MLNHTDEESPINFFNVFDVHGYITIKIHNNIFAVIPVSFSFFSMRLSWRYRSTKNNSNVYKIMLFDMGFYWRFVFTALGLCVGSFINVVIYRLLIIIADNSSTNAVNSKEVRFFAYRFNLFFMDFFVQIVITF